MGERLQEVGRRRLERDLERLVVDRLDAELGGFAGGNLGRILDRILQIGVLGRRLGVEQARERVDEVLRRHRLAVGPLGVGPQLERIDRAVIGDGPDSA